MIEKVPEKQKRLLKNVASRKFKTVRAAAIDAGYSRQATDGSLTKAIQSAHRNYLNALIEAGATDEKSARVISEGMDAEFVTKSGVVLKNHKIRLDANEQYLKVKRLLESEEFEKQQQNTTVIVNVVQGNPEQDGNNVQAARFAVPDLQ